MKKSELRELYQMMFLEYPDIVTVKELREMLGISRKLAYKLIDYGYIHAVKIGTTLKIPKISVINYVMEKEVIYLRRDSSETKRKILTVCVRLFLEQGYKNTTVSQIVDEAGVARGSYLNLFPTKDRILLELTETMFGGQFGMARSIADIKLPPVYAYAVETVIQLTLTELNENLREIYIEAYSLPETSEYIYLHTTAELKQIFGANFPDYSDSDFYEMEIGTAGLMRSYMARKCDIHFPLERKLSRFLTAAMRVYRVPEEEQAKVLAFIQSLDIKAIATEVMYKLFAMLEMKYDFKLSKNGEMEETR